MSASLLKKILLGASFAVLSSAGGALADDPPPAGGTPPATTTETPATTTTTTTDPAGTTGQTVADTKAEDPIVCKKEAAPTGSRTGARKICKPASEWRQQAASARESVDQIQTQGRADNPAGN